MKMKIGKLLGLVVVSTAILLAGCGKSDGQKIKGKAKLDAVSDAQQQPIPEEQRNSAGASSPATGNSVKSPWIEIVCYEKQSTLPILGPPMPIAFQENGNVVVIRRGGPEEETVSAQVEREKVTFSGKSPEYIYTIDRIVGTFTFGSNGDIALRGTCSAVKDRHF
jgi:hypothetical protein